MIFNTLLMALKCTKPSTGGYDPTPTGPYVPKDSQPAVEPKPDPVVVEPKPKPDPADPKPKPATGYTQEPKDESPPPAESQPAVDPVPTPGYKKNNGTTTEGGTAAPMDCKLALEQSYSSYGTAQKQYTQADVLKDWPGAKQIKLPAGLTTVGDSSISAGFPKGKILGSDTGFSWMSPIPKTDSATIQYDVFFEEGFDFTKGGKLPGLCGGSCYRGCSHGSNGWSTRIMWQRRGGMITYAYLQDDDPNKCGQAFDWDITITPGKWYNIKMTTIMNDVGSKNGKNMVWVDGKKVFEKTDMEMRSAAFPTVQIDTAYIVTYVGGSTQDFAPDHDQTIQFKNFKVGAGEC